MQALTRTVFPCYAAADRQSAAALAQYLEAGMAGRVLLDEGELRTGENLAEKAREGRMADVVLVLFSRSSLPSPWPRAKWEDALLLEPAAEGVRIAFLKLDDCAPPRVLVPRFDLAGLPVERLRQIKRWIRTGLFEEPAADAPELADLAPLAAALADRAGIVTVERSALALAFTRAFRRDFDDVIRLECGGRSMAALAGDLASQLGMRLEGDLAANLARLRQFCCQRRLLLWLEGASPEESAQLAIGAGTSTVISSEPRAEAPLEDQSLRDIQYLFRHPGLADDWAELCRLARHGFRLASAEGRRAEGFELLEQWHALAEARADRRILEEAAREMVWILQSWDRFEEARRVEYRRASEYADQMLLF